MIYKLKEYKAIFDTPAKKLQEKALVVKIMDFLNQNKYDDIDEFINKNPNYQDFLKNSALVNVMKHFGNTLNEEDYLNVLNQLKKLTMDKKNFEKEGIKTTTIDGNVYNSLEGKDKTYFVDNSIGDQKIEQQMEALQPTSEQFQTSDLRENTENMFKELESRKKEGLNLVALSEINQNMLNEHQMNLLNAAINFQLGVAGKIRVDLEKGVIVTENNEIYKIQEENNTFTIKGEDGTDTKSFENESEEKSKQFILKPADTIYSDNN